MIKQFAVWTLLVFAMKPLWALDFAVVKGKHLLTAQEVSVEPAAKGLVVAFLSAKCPCSQSHIHELEELAQKNREFNFVGIHSNMDEAEDMARKYFAEIALPFPIIQDFDTEIADRFKALKTPHVFIVTPDGEIVFRGGLSDSKDCARAKRFYLREALADMNSGKKPREENVRTLGCAIVRRKSGG